MCVNCGCCTDNQTENLFDARVCETLFKQLYCCVTKFRIKVEFELLLGILNWFNVHLTWKLLSLSPNMVWLSLILNLLTSQTPQQVSVHVVMLSQILSHSTTLQNTF